MIIIVYLLALLEMSHAFRTGSFSLRHVARFDHTYRLNAKKSLADFPKDKLKGLKVLVRCDLNVPLDGKRITDDTRIRASIPTLNYLLEGGAKVAACSHLGRPKNGPEDKFSLEPCATRLAELCPDIKVRFVKDCVGPEVAKVMKTCREGELVLLENVRFHKEEEANDPSFSKQLAQPFDMYVNDAFGSAHRAHASTSGVTKFLEPKVSGFLMSKELKYLQGVVDDGKRPLAAIIGGSKVSSKIDVLNSLIDKCDKLLIGGAMIFTFFAAQGLKTGSSMVEKDFIETAKQILKIAAEKKCEIVLPVDIRVADSFSNDAKNKIVDAKQMPDGWMGLDIGNISLLQYIKKLEGCKTIIWNGPMGVFEFDNFAGGSLGIAKALAHFTTKGAVTVVGGGDTVALMHKSGYSDQVSHISTGGGASLELLEGKELPGVAALDDA